MVKKTYEEASGFGAMAVTGLKPAKKTENLYFPVEKEKRPIEELYEAPEPELPKSKKHRFKKDKTQLQQSTQDIVQDRNVHPSRQIDTSLPNPHRTNTHIEEDVYTYNSDKIPIRERKLTCFNCRKTGHTIQRCPSKPVTTQRVCYICGSIAHSITRCLKPKDPLNPFPFAECFVCKQKGHISGACPDNAQGVYPKGGSCVHCGSVRHLAKDCDEKKEKKREEIELGVVDLRQGADDDDVHIGLQESRAVIHEERIRRDNHVPNAKRKIAKVVKF